LFDLKGRAAIVTGGNSGIGFGMATGLAEAGADIVLAARNADKAAKACATLRKFGRIAEFVPLDILSEASCASMITEAFNKLGRIDILVNNAGMSLGGAPESYSLADFKKVLDANLTGALACSQAAYPHMKQAGGGKIINVASIAANVVSARMTGYAPSKAGLVQLTKVLAAAWAKDNIQVNSVLPGWIDTDMARAAPPAVLQKVIDRAPARRLGKPEEFAGIAVYLASPASDFMTGSAIVLDGGYSSTQ
jgi:2-dehydro-3-deoxy-D-gluconate 5-dehydrogenase